MKISCDVTYTVLQLVEKGPLRDLKLNPSFSCIIKEVLSTVVRCVVYALIYI